MAIITAIFEPVKWMYSKCFPTMLTIVGTPLSLFPTAEVSKPASKRWAKGDMLYRWTLKVTVEGEIPRQGFAKRWTQ